MTSLDKKAKKRLTQKKEELAQSYILNHGNQSKAYREVYPDNKSTPASIWTLASKAFRDIEVQSRIQELQDLATERHLVTVATITDELDENRTLSKDEGQGAAMTAATVAKAKLHGLMIDRQKSTVTHNISDEFLEAIKPTTGLPSDREE